MKQYTYSLDVSLIFLIDIFTSQACNSYWHGIISEVLQTTLHFKKSPASNNMQIQFRLNKLGESAVYSVRGEMSLASTPGFTKILGSSAHTSPRGTTHKQSTLQAVWESYKPKNQTDFNRNYQKKEETECVCNANTHFEDNKSSSESSGSGLKRGISEQRIWESSQEKLKASARQQVSEIFVPLLWWQWLNAYEREWGCEQTRKSGEAAASFAVEQQVNCKHCTQWRLAGMYVN